MATRVSQIPVTTSETAAGTTKARSGECAELRLAQATARGLAAPIATGFDLDSARQVCQ
jgi:hypothetical protein